MSRWPFQEPAVDNDKAYPGRDPVPYDDGEGPEGGQLPPMPARDEE